jgi:hypothetical protein
MEGDNVEICRSRNMKMKMKMNEDLRGGSERRDRLAILEIVGEETTVKNQV